MQTTTLPPRQRLWNTGTNLSKVNLALASGLLGCALDLERPWPLAAPATSRTTYSFDFEPHADLGLTLTHRQGQVEIDVLFVGRRKDGRDCVFVLEAKDDSSESLAKHKLAYPIFALRDRVPPDMPLVPVYLRTKETDTGVRFDVLECELRGSTLSNLRPVSHSRLLLPELPLSSDGTRD